MLCACRRRGGWSISPARKCRSHARGRDSRAAAGRRRRHDRIVRGASASAICRLWCALRAGSAKLRLSPSIRHKPPFADWPGRKVVHRCRDAAVFGRRQFCRRDAEARHARLQRLERGVAAKVGTDVRRRDADCVFAGHRVCYRRICSCLGRWITLSFKDGSSRLGRRGSRFRSSCCCSAAWHWRWRNAGRAAATARQPTRACRR